jgi:hypothetical protein
LTKGKTNNKNKQKKKLFPGLDAKNNKIVLNDFHFLQKFISKLKPKKKPKTTKRRTRFFNNKKDLTKHLKVGIKAITRQREVSYGTKRFKNINKPTIINKEKIKSINGKKIKETETHKIERKKVEASNKLPLTSTKSKRRRKCKFLFYFKINFEL